jgi:hypothetical protein
LVELVEADPRWCQSTGSWKSASNPHFPGSRNSVLADCKPGADNHGSFSMSWKERKQSPIQVNFWDRQLFGQIHH